MPTYLKAKWNGCSISARPIGCRRIIRFWPYFQGDRVRLRLAIRQSTDTKPDTLSLREEYSADNLEATSEIIDEIEVEDQLNRKSSWDVKGSIIQWPGSMSYVIHGRGTDMRHQPIMTLYAHPNEKLTLIYIGLIGTAIGALIVGILVRF